MKYRDLTGGATSLVADALNAELQIHGANAETLQALLRGGRIAESGLTLEIDNPDAGPRSGPADSVARIELPDGELISASGAPAHVILHPTAGPPGRLVPQALNLGLAQQWARTGRMMVHGACLLQKNRGVLVLGRKASGKSILCMAALSARLQVVSDDWLLLGCDSGSHIAERLREFLMVRESWASRQLGALAPSDGANPVPGRPKRVIATDSDEKIDSAAFPRAAAITDLWLLRRPEGARARVTRASSLSRSAALAALIESTMPLLFSGRFPHERDQLMDAARRLIERVRPRQIVTGTDLIEAPAATLAQLLGEGKSKWNRD